MVEQRLTTTELTDYLKTIISLEQRLYEQTVLETEFKKKAKRVEQLLQNSTKQTSSFSGDLEVIILFSLTFGILGVLCSWALFIPISLLNIISGVTHIYLDEIILQFGMWYLIIFLVLGIIVGMISGILCVRIERKEPYMTNIPNCGEKHTDDISDVFLKFQKEVQKISDNVEKTEALLSNLYDVWMLDKKYQNIVAVCTFYDYLSSGKCTKLLGENGMIATYESEIHSKKIFWKLTDVLLNLEEVKACQNVLYSVISDSNEKICSLLENTSAILESLNESTSQKDEFSELTQYNTKTLVSYTSYLGYYQQLSSKR